MFDISAGEAADKMKLIEKDLMHFLIEGQMFLCTYGLEKTHCFRLCTPCCFSKT